MPSVTESLPLGFSFHICCCNRGTRKENIGGKEQYGSGSWYKRSAGDIAGKNRKMVVEESIGNCDDERTGDRLD